MKKIFRFVILLPFVSLAQDSATGIRFQKNLTWEEIRKLAMAENKDIFVDCYTTWCIPCKTMDVQVYSSDSVGEIVNKNFISVKMQMDSSKKDDSFQKSQYGFVRELEMKYAIDAYPSFLFFSPDGRPLHKAIGYRAIDGFRQLCKDAMNPVRQYYTLREKFNSGKLAYTDMRGLIQQARQLNDSDIATRAGADYAGNYLSKQNSSNVYTKDNLDFLTGLIVSSKDSIFSLYRHNEASVDRVMGTGYVAGIADFLILKEVIFPVFPETIPANTREPVWDKLEKKISVRYGAAAARRNILTSKMRWYSFKMNWPAYTRIVTLTLNHYTSEIDMKNAYYINACAWNIFTYSNVPNELNSAAKWIKRITEENPTFFNAFDTYANLLYKLGRKMEAIAIESKAIQLAPQDPDVKSAYDKMLKSEPTWPIANK